MGERVFPSLLSISHPPVLLSLSLILCAIWFFLTLTIFYFHTQSPKPPPILFFLTPPSVCNSVSFSLLYLHNCCRMCARFSYSLTVSQKTTRTHTIVFVWSYRVGHYPWNRFDDVISLVFSPSPPPPLFLSILSLALSVYNSSLLSLSLERMINLLCVLADIYKFLRECTRLFCGYVQGSFADIQRSLLRMYAGFFLTNIQDSRLKNTRTWRFVNTYFNICVPIWCTLKHLVLIIIKRLNKTTRIPGNALSDALLKSRFQKFASWHRKKKFMLRAFFLARVTKNQRFTPPISFCQESCP